LPLIVWVYLHSNFAGGLRKTHLFCKCAYRQLKVIDFGIKRKRVCDFLLVRHSNIGPISLHFTDIAGFLHPTPSQP